MPKVTAILVDGGFFLKRYRSIKKVKKLDPQKTANDLWEMCLDHLTQAKGETYSLYRIFYYDCLPYDKKQHNPVTGKSIDFAKTEQYNFQVNFFEELKKKRKVALRLGVLEDRKRWIIKPAKTKDLLSKKIEVDDLTETDVQFDFTQKRVDIKIGLDIASITLKKQVDQIILISGDSDFVPAAKLARREGIDFILDNMYNPIKPHLFEHIDGLITKIPRPNNGRRTRKTK
ncbi:NYN domain-containing protein [Flagellimonas okinawensis]|uniref:NYN domain-containing protein n=1 Tax=Flagellimonas okinawensis TaxID=3031324 RepID=A0ABT5XPU1_9FLAO|nr:NYN domain-containing protein [[Muricauda] okinawensis]MDF0707817.1 NYN domain-containing protein [[Muricauda] okinawensis]